MEFPFGGHHRHHHHHHRNEDEEEEYPQPPPPSFGTNIESHQHNGPPPPPPPSYLYEQDGMFQRPPPPNYMYEQEDGMYQRPPPSYLYEQDGMFQRPPPAPQQPDFSGGYSSAVYSNNSPAVQHVSHELEEEDPSDEFRHHTHLLHHHTPPTSFVYQHTHETETETETETDVVGDGNDQLFNLPTVRVYSKAEPSYSLTIRDGRVILAPSDPTDVFQHWIKDEKYSVRVKDEEGFPSFSLVNKATGLAIKHSIGATHPVQLQPYNPDDLDASVLWTESRDLGDGFRTIRMINNIRLNLDAFNGDINHGGVHDGTTIVLWEWKKGDNQRWRIVRYCKSFNTPIQKGI